MLNQPQFVYSYTIPYYISETGESIELFVSEKTYELYFIAKQNFPITMISGLLHPFGQEQGEITVTLFDSEQAIIVIGTKDLHELSNELMDMVIACELERILAFHPSTFYFFLYEERTPLPARIFIDDLQQTLEMVPLQKQLLKKGYRIKEREQELLVEMKQKLPAIASQKKLNPIEIESGLFLINRLVFLYLLDKELYKKLKSDIQPYWPKVFYYVDPMVKIIKKQNITTPQGRKKAFLQILQQFGYRSYIKEITLDDIGKWKLPASI